MFWLTKNVIDGRAKKLFFHVGKYKEPRSWSEFCSRNIIGHLHDESVDSDVVEMSLC